MKLIIINPFIESQKTGKGRCKEAFIYFTTYNQPKNQEEGEDKEPFYYLPSSKNQGGESKMSKVVCFCLIRNQILKGKL